MGASDDQTRRRLLNTTCGQLSHQGWKDKGLGPLTVSALLLYYYCGDKAASLLFIWLLPNGNEKAYLRSYFVQDSRPELNLTKTQKTPAALRLAQLTNGQLAFVWSHQWFEHGINR
ncbi:hypothetical protein J6590_006308 [Homalodisca vitripennis]|nr:hypothetical protein J6590_006308 [Homalodisca vitripennis]